jgi:hypothetical protein
MTGQIKDRVNPAQMAYPWMPMPTIVITRNDRGISRVQS